MFALESGGVASGLQILRVAQDDKPIEGLLLGWFGGAVFYVRVFAGFEAALHYGLAHAV